MIRAAHSAFFSVGCGNIVFDARGFAWIINNVVQGTTYSSQALSEYSSPTDSRPTGVMARPGRRSRVEEFSAAVSRHLHRIPWGTVWEGNFGWGGINPSPAPAREWKRFSVHRVAPANLAPQRLLRGCLQGAGLGIRSPGQHLDPE